MNAWLPQASSRIPTSAWAFPPSIFRLRPSPRLQVRRGLREDTLSGGGSTYLKQRVCARVVRTPSTHTFACVESDSYAGVCVQRHHIYMGGTTAHSHATGSHLDCGLTLSMELLPVLAISTALGGCYPVTTSLVSIAYQVFPASRHVANPDLVLLPSLSLTRG
jgi:hypothetical protein